MFNPDRIDRIEIIAGPQSLNLEGFGRDYWPMSPEAREEARVQKQAEFARAERQHAWRRRWYQTSDFCRGFTWQVWYQTRSTVDFLMQGRIRDAALASRLPLAMATVPWWVSLLTIANLFGIFVFFAVMGSGTNGKADPRVARPIVIAIHMVLSIYISGLLRFFALTAIFWVAFLDLANTLGGSPCHIIYAWRTGSGFLVVYAVFGVAALLIGVTVLAADEHCNVKDHWMGGCGDYGRNFTWV